MISLQLLVSGLIRGSSESWEITNYSRPFPVIVVLRLCWKFLRTCPKQLLDLKSGQIGNFTSMINGT